MPLNKTGWRFFVRPCSAGTAHAAVDLDGLVRTEHRSFAGDELGKRYEKGRLRPVDYILVDEDHHSNMRGRYCQRLLLDILTIPMMQPKSRVGWAVYYASKKPKLLDRSGAAYGGVRHRDGLYAGHRPGGMSFAYCQRTLALFPHQRLYLTYSPHPFFSAILRVLRFLMAGIAR